MCIAATLSLAAPALAEDQWLLAVEPSFMDHKMRRSIDGSKRTILSISRVVDGEIEPLTREQKKTVHRTFDQIRTEALKTASATLAKMTPEFFRDQNGVIRHAALESPDPLTASSVLAPEFADTFRTTLGPDLLIAIPTRNQILVFSRQDDAHLRLSETIIGNYLSSNFPVSREIFALENGHLRSLGVLQ
jgi:cytochrome c-type biogenesis protein CcmE